MIKVVVCDVCGEVFHGDEYKEHKCIREVLGGDLAEFNCDSLIGLSGYRRREVLGVYHDWLRKRRNEDKKEHRRNAAKVLRFKKFGSAHAYYLSVKGLDRCKDVDCEICNGGGV